MNKLLNLSVVFKVLGLILLIISISILSCIPVALIYNEPTSSFYQSSLVSFLFGLLLYLLSLKSSDSKDLTKRDAYFTVTVSWILITIIGALPYLFSQTIPNIEDAIFESISGFSTTGASILTNIEILPKSMLYWRSLTHWIGGIGIIVLVIIVLPSFKIGSYNLFTLESSLKDKIQPKTRSVGIRLVAIYLALTITEIILLMLGKMNLFDSICHTFGTVATGGFSTQNTSIANYSPYIQYVIMIFMFLGGMNFVIFYYIFKKQFSKINANEELRFYFMVVTVIGIIVGLSLYFYKDLSPEESFRHSFFQVISMITTTGYMTYDYMILPEFIIIIFFFTLFLGGCTGSTAGSIKMARHLILFKNIKNRVSRFKSPNAIIPIRLNGNIIETNSNNSILNFTLVYITVFLLGSIVLIAFGNDIKTSASSIAACLGAVGPGIGSIGPTSNFAHLSEITKYILVFMMILGRLEIFTFIMLLTRTFWKN